MRSPPSRAPDACALACLLASAALLTACTPPPAAAPVVPAVYVTPVRNDSGSADRVLSATVRPRVESEIAFRTGGKVTARLVELGQTVRSGQALARIDAVDYQLAVQAAVEQQRAAEVDAVQSASDAARFQRLLADGSVGAADAERQQARADAAAARLTQARSQLDLARNRAGYAVLAAPFDGVITALRFEPGQVVAEGQTVLSIARPGELEVQADVPEALAPSLKDWQASARLGPVGQKHGDSKTTEVPLRLRELAPSASASTRTYRARFTITAPPPGAGPVRMELRIGMTAELRLALPGRVSAAELPLSALLMTGANTDGTARPAVWLADAKTGALTRQPVTLLSQTTETVRVAGLADGALVVSVGAQKLDGGMQVQPVPRPLAALAGEPRR